MQQWEQWKQWLWPSVVLVVVAWAGAALIALVVAESRSFDIGEESVVRIDQAAEWVACQALITNQVRAEGGGTSLSTADQIRVTNECHIPSSAWILCTDEEISKLNDEELAAFQSSDAVAIVELCKGRVGEQGGP